MTEFVAFKPKKYSYLTDDNDKNNKAKGTQMCFIKRKVKFEDHKNCLEAIQLENRIN